jgi:hypothetical protein
MDMVAASRICRNLVVCLCAPIVAIGGGFIATAGLLHALSSKDPEPTRLQVNVQTAREIQKAINTPVAQPEPLGPITASRARPNGSRNATTIMKPEKHKRAGPGYDAMARGAPTEASSRSEAAPPAYDRHALQ